MKIKVYAARSHRWRENSLESADENITRKFDWYIIRKFGPYIARYPLPRLKAPEFYSWG